MIRGAIQRHLARGLAVVSDQEFLVRILEYRAPIGEVKIRARPARHGRRRQFASRIDFGDAGEQPGWSQRQGGSGEHGRSNRSAASVCEFLRFRWRSRSAAWHARRHVEVEAEREHEQEPAKIVVVDLDQEMLHIGQVARDDDDEHPEPVGDQRQRRRDAQQQRPRAQVVPVDFTLQRGDRQRNNQEMQAAASARDLERTGGDVDEVPLHRHGNADDLGEPEIDEGRQGLQQRVEQFPYRQRKVDDRAPRRRRDAPRPPRPSPRSRPVQATAAPASSSPANLH